MTTIAIVDYMSTHSTQSLKITVVEEAKDFAALEQEWGDLYHNSALATPFQSWAWLYSWWEFYREDYELRLVTARNHEGLLIAIIPLMQKRKWGYSRLLFVGTGLTDYLDVLTREGWEAEASEAGVRALRQMSAWQVADLHQLRPAAAAWRIIERWDGPKTQAWQYGCPVIDVKPWDELLMSFKRKMRYDVRRALRRAEEDGIRCEPARPEDAEQAARRWVALHREAWRGREIEPQHLTRRFELHLEAAVCRMTACGLGGLYEFRRNGEVIASHFLVFGRDFVGEYLAGATQEALARYQVSSLNIWNGVNVALRRNSTYLDLLRGEEPYKMRWTPTVVSTHQVILGRRGISWAPYATYSVLRSRAKKYVNSHDAPRWIKRALTESHVLRRRVKRHVGRGK
jgi:CelD/BcsL family acetyltransferase involved in cellulose biosynthesis